MSKYIFLIFILFIYLLNIWAYFYLWKLKSNLEEENDNLRQQIQSLEMKINKITWLSLKKIKYLLEFYREYFKSRNQLYILDIIWIIETALPTDNYVKNITINTNTANIVLLFRWNQLTDLIKIKENFE